MWQNLPVKACGPGLLLVGRCLFVICFLFFVFVFFFHISISFLVLGLFKLCFFLTLFWWAVCFQKFVCFFSSNLLTYNCSWYFFMVFCIFAISVVISPFSFLCLFGFSFLGESGERFVSFVYPFKEQLLVLLIFLKSLFISSLIFMISFCFLQVLLQ